MSQLNKPSFEALYNNSAGGAFPTNTIQAIGSNDLRQFAKDIADSFLMETGQAIQSWKEPCRVATTVNITLSGAQTIDTVSAIAGDRVLVQFQRSEERSCRERV